MAAVKKLPPPRAHALAPVRAVPAEAIDSREAERAALLRPLEAARDEFIEAEAAMTAADAELVEAAARLEVARDVAEAARDRAEAAWSRLEAAEKARSAEIEALRPMAIVIGIPALYRAAGFNHDEDEV